MSGLVDAVSHLGLGRVFTANMTGNVVVIAFAAPDATATTYALIALTAFAMGLRNAAVRSLGIPDLTTTVLTMTLTAVIRLRGGP